MREKPSSRWASAVVLSSTDKCKTTDPDIFAIGECALFGGRIYGLVAPGYRMAEAVVAQLSGEEARFTRALT